MAINKKLISFATQAQFDAQLSAGNIDNRSIVFIEDKKRIWTHGVYFDTSWDFVTGKPGTYAPSAHTLASHSDVTITSNSTGEILKWNGSKWINNTLAEAGAVDLTTNQSIGGAKTFSNVLKVQRGMSDYASAFTSPHIMLSASSNTDNTGFVGISYATSSSDNYGWTVGSVRSTNGNGDFVFKNHVNNTAGTERVRISGSGTVTASTFSGALSGNASTATTLATARTIGITGGVTGTATSFNGSKNISIPVTAIDASKLTTGTVPDARLSGIYTGFTHRIDGANTIFTTPSSGTQNSSGRTVFGLAEFRSSTSAAKGAIVFIAPFTKASTIMKSIEIDGMLYSPSHAVRVIINNYTGALTKKMSYGTIDIQVRVGETADGKFCVILGDIATTWSYPHFTLSKAMFSHSSVADSSCYGWTTALVTDLTGYTNISAELANSPIVTSITGNAATATKLATARTINGTSFNGSANITTTNWGTSRTITVGSTGKSVNGGSNVSWTLAEIGAAPASHTHSYLPLAGGTLTGSSYNMLELKRSSANGSSMLFSNSSVNLGKIGFTANGNLIIGTGASTDGVANMLSITPSGVVQFYGNISTSGLVTGTGFSKTGATDAHMLLGSGGHKAISDFNASLVTSTANTGTTNVATSNTNTYLNIVQGGSSVGSSTQIMGSDGVSVSSNTSGRVTVAGVGDFRDYGLGTSAGSVITDNMDTPVTNALFSANASSPTNSPTGQSYPMGINFYRSASVRAQISIGHQALTGIAYRGYSGSWKNWVKVWDENSLTKLTQLTNDLPNFTRTVAGLVPAPGAATTTRYLREDGTWVIPPNTGDTHWTTGIRAGASGTNTNSVANDPFIKVLDNTTYRSQIQILGGTNITATSDATGKITIDGTHNHDTRYKRWYRDQGVDVDANRKENTYLSGYRWINTPIDGIGILETNNQYSNDWVTQEFTRIVSQPRKFIRSFHSGNTWGSWFEFWHSGNLTKVSQLSNDSGYITASASITGNAATASAVSTSAENTGTTSRYILFANNASGNQALKTDTGLKYVPSTNTITATLSGNASSASKVNNKLTLKFDTGTTENTNLYTYDGSAAKTIDIKAGSNVTLTKTANTVTISSTNTNTTYSEITAAQIVSATSSVVGLITGRRLKYAFDNITAANATNANILNRRSDHRGGFKPSDITSGALITTFSTQGALLSQTNNSDYVDVIGLSTYQDSSAGQVNALAFDKSSHRITHFMGTFGTSSWSSNKTLAYTDGTGASGTWGIDITGNAATASAVKLTADNTTNATRYPLFVSAATGNLSPRTDTGFTYNPSTGALTATSFVGNASTATKLASINTTFTGTYPVTFNVNGNIYSHTGITYTGSTNTLTAANFNGNASSATNADLLDGKHGSDYRGAITLPHIADYEQVVIGLVNLDNSNIGRESWSSGQIYVNRTNGTSWMGGVINYSVQKRYNYSAMWGYIDSTQSGIQLCTFTYNGVKYGGIRYYPAASQVYGGTKLYGSWSDTTPFVVKYRNNTGALNSEVDGSIVINGSDVFEQRLRTSGNIYAFTSDNVASATKLQTARTLTIGSKGKTFDGSANVSWTLAEIGAAPTSHTHSGHDVKTLGHRLTVDSDGKVRVNHSSYRRAGMYGIYDSSRIGHIWSMGNSYQIAADGANFGNLYGLAYKHTNNSTGGTMGGGHQVVWATNGNPTVSLGSNVWTSGGFLKNGSSNSYVLLGGGGHTALSNLTNNTGIRVGASQTATNTAVTSPYIKVVDNESYREQFRLIGGSNVTITSDASKNVTITAVNTNTTYSNFTRTVAGLVPAPGATTTTRYLREDGSWVVPPNTNTTYSVMSVAEGTTGTATTSRTVRADYLKQIIQHYAGDTNSVTGITAGASGTNANSSTSNPYIKVKDDSTHRSQIRLVGSGATSISSNTSGTITISSTNTVYSHPTGDGNLHVPATVGSANNGKVLKAGSTAGSISWGTLGYADVGAAASSHTHSDMVKTTGTQTIGGAKTFTSNVTAPGFFQSSDIRLKNVIKPLKINIKDILNIPSFYFTYKDKDNKRINIGTSAQEVQKVFPEIVSTNSKGMLSVEYDKFGLIALELIKTQQKEIDSLKYELNNLKLKIDGNRN